MRQPRHPCLLLLLCLAIAPTLRADVTLTFESLSEGDVLINQFAGLGMTASGDPVVFTAGSWLNEFDFPPHSGSNVLVDANGPVLFAFAGGVASVSGFFTYATQLTFDVYRPDRTLLTTAFSSAVPNFGSSEQISFGGDIGFLSIAGDPAGLSFTLDDLSFASGPQVPEPSAILLFVPIAALALRSLRKNAWR